MNYWWVNQNITYLEESTGGYMWSPKKNKSGHNIHHWVTMPQVLPGDIVFSFRRGGIPSIGIIQSSGYSSPKPSDFGVARDDWSKDGWCVDVEYHEVSNVIRPKQHIDRIARATTPRYLFHDTKKW